MADLYLITPPDKIYNRNQNLLLIYPTDNIKQEIQHIFEINDDSWNVYLFEDTDINQNITWLLDMHRICDVTIIDIDNIPSFMRDLISYFISFTNTYWRSQGENLLYNRLSCTRFWHCEDIQKLNKGNSELP